MPRFGHRTQRQRIGRLFRPRRADHLHQVDIEVRGLLMAGVARQHALDQRDGLVDARARRTACSIPVVPWTGVHRRFGGQHRQLIVARCGGGQAQHGIGIGRIHRGAVCLGIGGIARRQRPDQRAVQRRRVPCQSLRLRQCAQRRCQRLGLHRRVDIGALHQRFAPEAQRASGRERLRLAERGDRSSMVEVVGHEQALIEPRPRCRRQASGFERRTRHSAI